MDVRKSISQTKARMPNTSARDWNVERTNGPESGQNDEVNCTAGSSTGGEQLRGAILRHATPGTAGWPVPTAIRPCSFALVSLPAGNMDTAYVDHWAKLL